jgi:hypothetical protein
MQQEKEELKSNQEKRAERINAIANQLNEIKTPLVATVYSEGMKWTIRNVAFWEHLKAQDEKFMELINIDQS